MECALFFLTFDSIWDGRVYVYMCICVYVYMCIFKLTSYDPYTREYGAMLDTFTKLPPGRVEPHFRIFKLLESGYLKFFNPHILKMMAL